MIKSVILALVLSLPGSVSAEQLAAVLDWSQRAVLSTPVSGVIGAVPVRPGQQVAAGQLLLSLDPRPFRNALADAEAQVNKHRLHRDEARRELERTRELYERTVISVHDLQLAEIAFAAAQSDHASAEAALAEAQLQLEYSRLQAPFAGIVLAVPVTTGMTVVNTQQATPLVTLAQHRPMHARVPVPGARLAGLAVGQAATVIVGGQRFAATLAWTGVEPDDSGHYRLIFAFDPGAALLRAGQSAQVELQ